MAKELLALIKEKQAQLATLQAELDEAKALLNETSATARRARAAARASGGAALGLSAKAKTRLRRRLEKLRKRPAFNPESSVGRAVELLRESGAPLHINELLARLEKRGHKVNKNTLVGNIARHVKRGVIFYRAKPSVFGLLELKKGA